MSDWWDACKSFFGLVKKSSGYPQSAASVYGYGPVNRWFDVDPGELGDALVKAKCNCTCIELLGHAEAGHYDNTSKIKDAYPAFVAAMRRRRIMVYCIVLNWNKGKGSNGNGSGPSLCDARYDTTWFNNVLKIVRDEGMEGVCLEAAAEWADAFKECTAKAQSFCDHAAANWAGQKGWNKGSRPMSAPATYWLNYHINSCKPAGPVGCIDTTDTSTVLNELGGLWNFANPDKLKALAAAVKKSGRGFLYYGFGHKSIDQAGLDAMGKV